MTKTMNKAKYLLAFLAAAVLAVALSSVAWAANGTITINPPEGVDAQASNTYKVYKVFDAVGDGEDAISYKLVPGKTTAPSGFTVDTAGNVSYTGNAAAGNDDKNELTEIDIAAIAAYVANDNPVATLTATGSAAVTTDELPNGYYYITTSVGTVVTIDSTNPSATVNDKNDTPTLDKRITAADSVSTDNAATETIDEAGKTALAQVGSNVEYTATITVAKGAKGYVFHDTMENTLSYNNDVKVIVGDDEVQGATGEGEDSVTNFTVGATNGDTITITFDDAYIAKLAVGTQIKVVYSAKIMSDALTVDAANNTAYLSYGDENSNNKTPDSTTETYNAKFTVIKTDGKSPLEGAGFVISKTVADESEDAEEDATKTVYYAINENVVSWVDSINDATELTTVKTTTEVEGQQVEVAQVVFTGLADGTYTLIEKSVPAGYNKAADFVFTVNGADTTTAANRAQETTVVNNQGTELPSTGGMGTTILYIVGGILVAVALIVLITKRRVNKGHSPEEL